jgi:hypothetical protein
VRGQFVGLRDIELEPTPLLVALIEAANGQCEFALLTNTASELRKSSRSLRSFPLPLTSLARSVPVLMFRSFLATVPYASRAKRHGRVRAANSASLLTDYLVVPPMQSRRSRQQRRRRALG